MEFINRLLAHAIPRVLSEDKSILLLGPQQSGKTSLLNRYLSTDLSYNFLDAAVRQNFEQNPDALIQAIKAYQKLARQNRSIIVRIDGVEKIPAIVDNIQYAIDNKLAKFIVSSSSVRKLKPITWPVIELRMDALNLDELKERKPELNDLLLYGSLPAIIVHADNESKESLLMAYVKQYLEEVRNEALVRNLANFSKFLKYAAMGSGEAANVSYLSKEVGVARPTINEYYQICEDTLMAERIDPLIHTRFGRRLSKTPKYLIFDLGVRRIAAGEGTIIPEKYHNDLFKQFVGLELLKLLRAIAPAAKLCYWKDHNGPEIDYVIEYYGRHIPIEVKYSHKPTLADAKHLRVFQEEYPCMSPALIICRVERAVKISEDILAIHWRELSVTIRKMIGAVGFAEVNRKHQPSHMPEFEYI